MNDDIRDLAKQLHESQAKHADFLLAVAGSCIALCVRRTTGVAPSWSMLILALAVLCWAGSILAGLSNREYFQAVLHANVDFLKIRAGENPEVGTHPDVIAGASTVALNAGEFNCDKTLFYARLQTRLLLAGAALFLVWHVIEMFAR